MGSKENVVVPYLSVHVNGKKYKAYIDTGATTTLIADKICNSMSQELIPYHGSVTDASGNQVPILGGLRTKIITAKGDFYTKVLVFKKNENIKYDVLLGMNILSYTSINFNTNCIIFDVSKKKNECTKIISPLNIKIKDLKIHNKDLGRHQPKSDLSNIHISKEETEITNSVGNNKMNRNCRNRKTVPNNFNVHLNSDLKVPSNSVSLITVPINKQIQNGCDIVLNHSQITPSVALANVITRVNDGYIKINIINVGNNEITLKQGTKLSTAEYLETDIIPYESSELVKVAHTSNMSEDLVDSTNSHTYQPLTQEDITCSNSYVRGDLLNLLNRYRETYWLPGEQLGCYKGDQL